MASGRLTGGLAYAIFAAVLGMFRFGYNTGVINAPQAEIVRFINGTAAAGGGGGSGDADVLFSLAVSLFAVGGMLGSLAGGWASSRWGRRGALLTASTLGALGSVLQATAKPLSAYAPLALGRLIVGLDAGLATSAVPMFVSEISPVELRGAVGTLNQLAVTFGLVFSQVLGIGKLLGDDAGWPYLLGVAVFPAALQTLLMLYCPESPRYLLVKDEVGARRALEKLRGTSEVDEDIEEMRAEDRAERSEASVSIVQILKSSSLRAPLMIGVVLHLSQQLSGINGVFYYSTKLFGQAGLAEAAAKQATIGIGVTMFIMTLVTVPLMDSAGRRTLHLTGLAGMFVSSILMTVALYTYESSSVMTYFSVLFTFVYCGFFGLGPGSIPWMIMSELFSQGARPSAVAFGACVNWLANFVVGLVFTSMSEGLGNAVFVPFTVLLAFFWIFAYFKMPETKNRTIEEIATLFKR